MSSSTEKSTAMPPMGSASIPAAPAIPTVRHSALIDVPGPGPMFAGHFPGRPILPGARLLDLILRAMAVGPVELQVVKFLATVAPASRLRLDWSLEPGGRVSFECHDEAHPPPAVRLVATGKLRPW